MIDRIKSLSFGLGAVISFSVCAGAEKIPQLDNYKDVEIININAKGICISHSNGATVLTEEKLSDAGKILLKEELLKVKQYQKIAEEKNSAEIKQHTEAVNIAIEKSKEEKSASKALDILNEAKKNIKATNTAQLEETIKIRETELVGQKQQILKKADELLELEEYDQAVNQLLVFANDAEIQDRLGTIYREMSLQRKYDNNKRKKFFQQSIQWYQKSINQKYIPAIRNLSVLYGTEIKGVASKNLPTAFSLMKLAADSGLPEAQYDLAKLYSNGIGTPKDSKKAMQYYERSAKNNYAPACYELGLLLEDSIGVMNLGKTRTIPTHVPRKIGDKLREKMDKYERENVELISKNREKVKQYFRKAAELGHAPAMLSMAKYSDREDEYNEWIEKAKKANPKLTDLIARKAEIKRLSSKINWSMATDEEAAYLDYIIKEKADGRTMYNILREGFPRYQKVILDSVFLQEAIIIIMRETGDSLQPHQLKDINKPIKMKMIRSL